MRFGLSLLVDISDEAITEGIAERFGGHPIGTTGIGPSEVEVIYAFPTADDRWGAFGAMKAAGISIKSYSEYDRGAILARREEEQRAEIGTIRDFGDRLEERGRAYTRPREEDVASGFFEADHFF